MEGGALYKSPLFFFFLISCALIDGAICGAGTTRDNFEGKKVLRLEYEAYMPMARKKMLETCSLMRSKWSIENIVMLHRIG